MKNRRYPLKFNDLKGVFLVEKTLNAVFGQSQSENSQDLRVYFSQLPVNLELKEDGPQKYLFVCDDFNLDCFGNLTGKERTSAEYTRALGDGKVQWNNIRVAQAKGFDDPIPEGEWQQNMEGFSYQPNMDIMTSDFFRKFPATEMKIKHLVLDVYMFEVYAWQYFDKLKLNQVYVPQSGPLDVPLAGSGTFQNPRTELTWIGISQMNRETCALIRYQAFFNKLNMTEQLTNIQGRSHHWGEIWVSLKNKQIEYGTLFEDVLVEIEVPGQQNKMMKNVFRKAVLQKMVTKKSETTN